MSGSHGAVVRGLQETARSPLFQGRFGRMFRPLPAASFGKTEADNLANLDALGKAMTAQLDSPKDGPDEEESGIPALYTYLGQFIDHDLTFDPDSSLQKANDPDALTDYRNPAFDLDSVYGRGPDDQPYMYEEDGTTFLLGTAVGGGSDANAADLPRSVNGRAIIGDPRNDENAIVTQFQALTLRFHNRIVKQNSGAEFEKVQELVRFHYQYLILHDFLPRIVHSSVLDKLKTNGAYDKSKLKFYKPKNEAFMPVEFSVAAYRFGHSMVRPGYRLNDNVLLPIFPVEGFPDGLTGFRPLNPAWALDWGRMVNVDLRDYDGDDIAKAKRLQFAYRIDTSLVNPLGNLPFQPDLPSLAARNLRRGWRLGLPSGQRVAKAMGVKPLADELILIGKAVDEPDEPTLNILSIAEGAFKDNCPLWTYVLAEAMHFREPVEIPVKGRKVVSTPRLGPVGGRIVAEVFLGLMFGDKNSLLSQQPDWTPLTGSSYTLKDFVRFALGF